MSELKQQLITEVIEREGGYSNDPSDRGGETMYGITIKVARRNGYQGEMKHLPYAFAFSIYQKRYWNTLKLDAISQISDEISKQLFDFGVNSGAHNAGCSFQAVLNVLNQQQAIYPDLVTDGILGSKTIKALAAFFQHRGNDGLTVLNEVIRGKRISFCIDIAINDQSQEKYQFGWLKRIVHL